MKLHWKHKQTEPFYNQGKDTTRPNFSREERSGLAILIREGLQNALDARLDEDNPVRVSFRSIEVGGFDADYLESAITQEFRERLRVSSGVELPNPIDARVLVIEDFGTKGLLGDYQDFDADGQDQNWNAFWHREGEGAKGIASNGGAGQGKVTYFAHSAANAIFGATIRGSDKASLLMGKAAFVRDYKFTDGKKYIRTAYWTASSDRPTPEMGNPEIERFSEAFNLSRQAGESGLSLVIPYAKEFPEDEAIVSVILDFYMPIVAGRLIVDVAGTRLSSETIDKIAGERLPDKEVLRRNSSFTTGYREFARGVVSNSGVDAKLSENWNRDRLIPESAFPEGSLELLKGKLEAGQRVGINLPIAIKTRSGGKNVAEFLVFIEVPEELERNEESFVRQDLLIGAESHVGSGAFLQKTRSMTKITDKQLSEFLLAAEEPTHLKWNTSLVRDRGDYVSPDVTLRAIRQAVPRLLNVLLGAADKKDFKALAKYFGKPSAQSASKKAAEGEKKKGSTTKPPPPPPPPIPKPFRIQSDGVALEVVPNGVKGPKYDDLPFTATLEVAYEGLDQDPFEAYDPFDFDLAHEEAYPVFLTGAEIESRKENVLVFMITAEDFKVRLEGFDPNVRLRARLTYDEVDGVEEAESDG